jgi:hypothetical protein
MNNIAVSGVDSIHDVTSELVLSPYELSLSGICMFLQIVGSSHFEMPATEHAEHKMLCFAAQISFKNIMNA